LRQFLVFSEAEAVVGNDTGKKLIAGFKCLNFLDSGKSPEAGLWLDNLSGWVIRNVHCAKGQ
jgi:hypothetical protein